MATHIAIEGEVPRPVNDIKILLPDVSFPADEITSTSGLETIIALATGYEPCTVGAVPSLAWNETAVLGAATRVSGALEANYTATAMSQSDADAVLAAAKQAAVDAMNAIDETYFNTPTAFANVSETTEVDLRPDQETLNNMIRLLVIAQNANTSATIIDANGNPVTLSLADMQEVSAAFFQDAAARVEGRAITFAAINAATTPSEITDAVNSHQETYG